MKGEEGGRREGHGQRRESEEERQKSCRSAGSEWIVKGVGECEAKWLVSGTKSGVGVLRGL